MPGHSVGVVQSQRAHFDEPLHLRSGGVLPAYDLGGRGVAVDAGGAVLVFSYVGMTDDQSIVWVDPSASHDVGQGEAHCSVSALAGSAAMLATTS